jgi:hypothetical protein
LAGFLSPALGLGAGAASAGGGLGVVMAQIIAGRGSRLKGGF